jgi:hypothetical protein
MAKAPKQYRKLPGRGASVTHYIRLYLAADHLLQVSSTGFTESYKRFYFRDIQSVTLRKTYVGKAANAVLGATVAIFAVPALFTSMPVTVVLACLAGFFAIGLGANIALGPTCVCQLQTAVQHERLRSLSRLRRAQKVLERLRPEMVRAQGEMIAQRARIAHSGGRFAAGYFGGRLRYAFTGSPTLFPSRDPRGSRAVSVLRAILLPRMCNGTRRPHPLCHLRQAVRQPGEGRRQGMDQWNDPGGGGTVGGVAVLFLVWPGLAFHGVVVSRWDRLDRQLAGTRMKKQVEDGPGAIALIEEGFRLLRTAPISTVAAYYSGTLPFMLAMLYFWSDMSSGVFADQRLATGATALCGLFVWMKCWQAVFARKLFAQLMGEPEPRWDRRRIARTVIAQAALQPAGLFLIPASAVILMPFTWVFTFYQNVVLFGAGDEAGIKTVFKRSWRQTAVWPAQNHCVVMALKAFGVFVLINLAIAALAVPFSMKALLGIETAFSQSWLAALNSTFFATIFSLTYLCFDPVIKATYVARCFHGQSLESGDDLRAELRGASKSGPWSALAACLFVLAGSAFGAEEATPVTPPALERSISDVIQKREYSWRMPRSKAPASDASLGWLERQLKSIGKALESMVQKVFDWFRKFAQWLSQNRRANAGGKVSLDWYSAFKALLTLLCIGLLVLLGVLAWRMWRGRHAVAGETAAQPLSVPPDLADERTAADQLPEDGWLKLARELLASGELRLALRAYYLASLAHLAERNLITIAPHKSNRDYEFELRRRAHTAPAVLPLFSENVSTFDRVWYGLHEVTRELLEAFASNVIRIKTC